jgi:uroporphyrinogen decarboxylase
MEKEMTSYERVMKAFEGGKPDRVPVLPTLREWCMKRLGFKFNEIIRNPEKYVSAQYQCLREFNYDGVWDPLGIHAESGAMGSVVNFPDDYPPQVVEFAVKDYARDLPRLKMPDPKRDGWLPIILEIISQLKDRCDGVCPVIGYVQAPFRHASMLRGSEFILRDVYKEKDNLKELLRITTESQIIWGQAVIEAGADIVAVADPTSSGEAVSKRVWEEFGLPSAAELIKSLKRRGTKVFLHICGDTNDRLESMLYGTGADCIHVDQKVDLAHARNVLGPKACIMGNVDPTYLISLGTPEEVFSKAKENIKDAGREGAFILSGGCLIADAPPENVKALVEAAKSFRY